jgi:hypothetical protein
MMRMTANLSPRAGATAHDGRMEKQFVDDDDGYLQWLATHPDDFVLNVERAAVPTNLVLHRSTCYTINTMPTRGSQWTGPYIKVCGTMNDLQVYVRSKAAAEPRKCKLCFG